MLEKKDLVILCELRKNSREALTKMSKRTMIPISTLFDKLKEYKQGLIIKHTTLIDYSVLGFNTRANVLLRVPKQEREIVKEYLMKHPNINSVFRVNNGFDFMFESMFQDIRGMEDFLEMLEGKFKITEKRVHYVIEDIKKESFLSDPMMIDLIS